MVFRQKSALRYLLCLLLAYLTVCSFYSCFLLYCSEEGFVAHFIWPVRSSSPVDKIVFPTMFLLFSRLYILFSGKPQTFRISDALLSLFYALSFLIGFCQFSTDSNAFRVPGVGFVGLSATVLSFFCFFYCILDIIHQNLDVGIPLGRPFGSDRRLRIGVVCFFILAWVPFFLCTYPGSVTVDTLNQLRQTWHMKPLSNNNPLFDTMIYGVLYQIGTFLGRSDNAGIAMNIFIQLLLYLFAFTYCVETVYRISDSSYLTLALTLYYGIVPVYGSAMRVMLKDSLHLPIVVLYFSFLIRLAYFPPKKHALWKFFLLFLAAALSRKAAFFYILAGAVVLWWLRRKDPAFRLLLPVILLDVVCFLGIENLLYPALGAARAPTRELLSIPIQGVAYITIHHHEDMPPELLNSINKLMNIDSILADYSPYKSDSMKTLFNGTVSELLHLYLSLIRRYPADALKSIIASSWRYFFPFDNPAGAFRQYIADSTPYNKNIYHVFPSLLKRLAKYTDMWSSSPLLTTWIAPGTHAWILLFTAARTYRKRLRKNAVLIIPMCILLVGLMFTPVNADTRYALPLFGLAPAALALVCGCSSQVAEKS